jgi:ribosomal protein S27AE
METIKYRGVVFVNPDNDERKLYRSKTTRSILRGILTKQVCEICGDNEVHAHHEKYSNYLNVRWLCPIHHKKIHSIFNDINREEGNREAILKQLALHPESEMWTWMLKDCVKRINEYYELYATDEKRS